MKKILGNILVFLILWIILSPVYAVITLMLFKESIYCNSYKDENVFIEVSSKELVNFCNKMKLSYKIVPFTLAIFATYTLSPLLTKKGLLPKKKSLA